MTELTTREISDAALLQHPGLYRNNNGVAFIGDKIVVKANSKLPVRRGDVLIVNPRTIAYGLHPGSGDYVGWEPIVITPDMVGQTIAQFFSLEVKSAEDRLSDRQRTWNQWVIRDGGRAEVWQAKDGKILIRKGADIT